MGLPFMNGSASRLLRHFPAAMLVLLFSEWGLAQEMEPRSFTNAPIGLNFFIAAYAYSEGGVSVDPSVPLTNANIETDLALLAYARVFEVAGQSAKVDFVLPYGRLKGTADYLGSPVEREISGLADPRLRFSMNFIGAPALSLEEFRNYQQDLIVGGSVQVSLPVGQYDADRLVNLGTNRWFIKPELGVSKAWGPWSLELSASATFFSDNDDFLGGRRREQDPVYTLQQHLVYGFRSGVWMAVTAAQLKGGRTMLDGVRKDDMQKSSRVGVTLALPIDRHNSLKLFANSGVTIRTGTDFDTVGLAWQHRWGGGL